MCFLLSGLIKLEGICLVSSQQVPWEDVGWCWLGHYGNMLWFGEASSCISSPKLCFNTAQSSGDGAAHYPHTQSNTVPSIMAPTPSHPKSSAVLQLLWRDLKGL